MRVTGVFSWKSPTRGDYLYDVARCMLRGPWHPGIATADLWRRTLAAPDPIAATLGHHCFELRIGASHLAWCTRIGDADEPDRVAAATRMVLERGPLPVASP